MPEGPIKKRPRATIARGRSESNDWSCYRASTTECTPFRAADNTKFEFLQHGVPPDGYDGAVDCINMSGRLRTEHGATRMTAKTKSISYRFLEVNQYTGILRLIRRAESSFVSCRWRQGHDARPGLSRGPKVDRQRSGRRVG